MMKWQPCHKLSSHVAQCIIQTISIIIKIHELHQGRNELASWLSWPSLAMIVAISYICFQRNQGEGKGEGEGEQLLRSRRLSA